MTDTSPTKEDQTDPQQSTSTNADRQPSFFRSPTPPPPQQAVPSTSQKRSRPLFREEDVFDRIVEHGAATLGIREEKKVENVVIDLTPDTPPPPAKKTRIASSQSKSKAKAKSQPRSESIILSSSGIEEDRIVPSWDRKYLAGQLIFGFAFSSATNQY